MASDGAQRQHTFKLKLKLTAPLVERTSVHGNGASARDSKNNDAFVIAPMDADPSRPILIGARGGVALKEILSTAPNPEEAIRAFQTAHGLNFPTKLKAQHEPTPTATTAPRFAPAEKLLDLLQVGRSGVYNTLLEKLIKEILLRIEALPQAELQKVLEATFPYIEFRELRKIPIAILARQEDTPEAYLRELTENRRILSELPVHVRRKILHVDRQELQFFVDQCTQDYVDEQLKWYLAHPSPSRTGSSSGQSSTAASTGTDLWGVQSHMPSPSSRTNSNSLWFVAPDERRRQSVALKNLSAMIGDSESLYLATLDIVKEYVAAASIPGSANTNAKDYVDYVPFLGALRSDLANLQRDKTTTLMRTDPLHKFIWFLDRAVKNQSSIDLSQLHELLVFIKKLRTGDVPLNKKFKKKSEIQEEEDNFEIVLGPPPVDQLLSVLDKIAKTDARFIFAEPVPDDVPNYKAIIKEPMDLSTMRKKARKGKYKSLDLFVDDFNLMIKNCMAFNPDTTVFYKEGKRVGKRGLEIIEKQANTLRGEPQRIRAKKRKKSGPAETMTMLTSSGIMTLKDFGDVDQTGMVPEGICEGTLADIAMILSDPQVKQMLCDSLLKTLVSCWQKRELPTDNLVCRGLVQLLQIGNPASVRRMLRKKDFILRAPQVVTMRVVLPLLIRSMATYRIGFATHGGLTPVARESKSVSKEDLSDSALWENMLRASSAIRSVSKAFILQSVKDHHVDVAAHLLGLLVSVEDDILFRDRVFLHALGELVLHDVKIHASSFYDHDGGNDGVSALKRSTVWKAFVDGFFVSTLGSSLQAFKAAEGAIVKFFGQEESDEADGSTGNVVKTQSVKAFAVPILHEKAVMVLASALDILDKAASSIDSRVVAAYVRKTLGSTRQECPSLDEFTVLWESQPFARCRSFYEQLLARCPEQRDAIFAAEYIASEPKDEKPLEITKEASDQMDVDGDADREAGEVDEDVSMQDEDTA